MTQLKLKTGEARAIFETVSGLVARKWPVKLAYWLSRMVIKLQAEYEASEKARIALAEEFGTKSEDGTQFVFAGDSAAQFTTRLNEVLNTELELDLPQIAVTSFENIEIEPATLIALDKLIVESL